MGNVKFLSDNQVFLCPISGGVGGCPPPVSPPVAPPPPPALPSLVGSPPSAKPGSVWVEGSELHYIASNGAEYMGTADSVATPPSAKVGSVYENGEDVFYIDASGVRRSLQKLSAGAKPAPSVQGSLWVDSAPPAGRQLYWIGGTNRYAWSNGF